ncbi:hypothetical protein [Hathewaya limosa]|uniref:asparagine synthase (glutamine-hydrolyzing) n=1 Tax=Hathewaya limosa TaxID=1536 RepID=A0ABU0JS10_HATLI|nr:hypothetical protein [Hathewaya limosa]AWZ47859.1 hypothetical protein C3495_03090 [Clostridiaceae bacterium 14S0207]MDQ0479051.1 asparagine synthase (glutamine-hydrolyzing) [Hathewaya limosa]
MGYTIIKSEKDLELSTNYLALKNLTAIRNFNGKFKEDKLFSVKDNMFYCIDGVILNLTDLKKKYGCFNIESLIHCMFKKHGINFVKELRGNFSGVVYDAFNDKIYTFTNQLGNKFVYYFFDKKNDDFIVSTNILDIVRFKKELGYNSSISEEGAYFMLTFGYMLMDYTMVDGVKKINPGCYLECNKNKLNSVRYFEYNNEDILDVSMDKAIDELYERFSDTVNLSFKKDKEYGLDHLSFLSGGMDSRMIVFTANKLGYKDINCINFSKLNSQDEKISRSICNDLNLNYTFNSLANGDYLKNIDYYISKNNGQILFNGAAHLVNTMSKVNLNKFGIVHNGNLADIMHGDYLGKPYHEKPMLSKWGYSNKLLNRVSEFDKIVKNTYTNEEEFVIFNAGINGVYNGSVSLHDNTETYEEYTDPTVVEYAMRLSPKYRFQEKLFIKMIQKHCPEATKYKWQKWNCKPSKLNSKIMLNRFSNTYIKILNKSYEMILGKNNMREMNPYDYWYNKNDNLRKYVDNYFKDNIHLLSKYSTLKRDCEELFKKGSFCEKAQVLTLLGFCKSFYNICFLLNL